VQPEKARYADGMVVNMLYEELCFLANPAADIDEFYGLEKRQPQTKEQAIVAHLSEQIKVASRANPLTEHTVTEEQRAALLGFEPYELTGLLQDPTRAYNKSRPTDTLTRLQNVLGVTISLEDWETIRKERAERDKQARLDADAERTRKRRERMQRRKDSQPIVILASSPTTNTDPWSDIAASIAELCARKGFPTLDSVVAQVKAVVGRRIAESISQGNPYKLQRHIKIALQNMATGFLPLPSGLPVTIMHAHLWESLGLAEHDLQVIQQKANGIGNNLDGKIVQANVVEMIRLHPGLAHVISWKQLADELQGAEVTKVSDNVAAAWMLDANTLTVRAANDLPPLVKALNRGEPRFPATPEGSFRLISGLRPIAHQRALKHFP
jgi:hypothetical protein